MSAHINVANTTVDMPVKEGTIGPSVIDIGKLYGQTGMFTYDPGFTSTSRCEQRRMTARHSPFGVVEPLPKVR